MRTPFDFDPSPRFQCLPSAEIARQATERLMRYAEDRYNAGVEAGLNIEENVLAQEVKRLREAMTDAGRCLELAVLDRDAQWLREAASCLRCGMSVPPLSKSPT